VIDVLQLIGAVVSGILLLVVLELVRRRRLSEEYSFFWIAGVVVLLGLSLWREILDVTARWIGIYYPPMVLVLALVLVVFIGLLYFSVVTSTLRRQIERLVEDQAILDADLRELSSTRAPSDQGLPAGCEAPDRLERPPASGSTPAA
jgi:hypothetical protein